MKAEGSKIDRFCEDEVKPQAVPMLELNEVAFSYRRDTPVYDRFSLALHSGQVCGLLGENGVGKTTLMKLMSSLLFPKEGEIRFYGEMINKRLPSVLSELFFVPEEVALPGMKKEKFLAFHAPFYPRFDRDLFEDWLFRFKVFGEERLDRLSMGERKKFYLSFAIATGCSFLLLDEPTNGLDIPAKDEFRRLIASFMTEERLVVISTHQAREVEQILDRLLILNPGRVVLDATLQEISEAFRFEVLPESELPPEPIYSEPVPGGTKVLYPNPLGYAEDEVDIEFLFKAVIQNPLKVHRVLEQSLKRNSYE